MRWRGSSTSPSFLPGTDVRFGIEAIIRLVPGIGDLVASALSCIILVEARRLGVPMHVYLRMIGKVVLEGTVGAVPLLGDAFDVLFRANRRNIRSLRDYSRARTADLAFADPLRSIGPEETQDRRRAAAIPATLVAAP
jgi:hypothetical protein